MSRKLIICLTLLVGVVAMGCSGEVGVPRAEVFGAGTSSQSPSAIAFAGVVPAGMRITHLGDVILLQGMHFTPDVRIFVGRDNQLARDALDGVSHLPRHQRGRPPAWKAA